MLNFETVEVMSERMYVPFLSNIVALKDGDVLQWNNEDIPQRAVAGAAPKGDEERCQSGSETEA